MFRKYDTEQEKTHTHTESEKSVVSVLFELLIDDLYFAATRQLFHAVGV